MSCSEKLTGPLAVSLPRMFVYRYITLPTPYGILWESHTKSACLPHPPKLSDIPRMNCFSLSTDCIVYIYRRDATRESRRCCLYTVCCSQGTRSPPKTTRISYHLGGSSRCADDSCTVYCGAHTICTLHIHLSWWGCLSGLHTQLH
jgi:hypothetical protein